MFCHSHLLPNKDMTYSYCHAAYDLSKLRGKTLSNGLMGPVITVSYLRSVS